LPRRAVRNRDTHVPSPTIRLATLTDVDVLVRLMRQFYAEDAFALSERAASRAFEALLEDTRLGQVWMIEHDGHPAGFVVVTVGFSMEYGGLRGFIDDFYVAPQYRRRGLGHAALEEVKRVCRRRGVRALVVETGPENDAAISAYHSVGFEDSHQRLLTLRLSDPYS
jgi:ribosomal protein S18 acetylase RimI-like enzyme